MRVSTAQQDVRSQCLAILEYARQHDFRIADLIDRNWADILRVAATMAAGTMRPSQIRPAC